MYKNFIDAVKEFNEKFPNAFDWAAWAENDETQLIDPQVLYAKHGLELYLTCGACPEQYEVFLKDTETQVGYLRLRHGDFRVDFPDCGSETIYEAKPNGNGCFDNEERMKYLGEALRVILEKLKE